MKTEHTQAIATAHRNSLRTLIQGLIALMALTLFVGAGTAKAQTKPSQTQGSSARSSLAEHEARRQKFQQMCTNPTPSQRESLKMWARALDKPLGPDFCNEVELYYMGTKNRPRDMPYLATTGGDSMRDISVFQYFTGLQSFGVGGDVRDLSPLIHLKALTDLGIGANKNVVDISVVSHLKNLKTLSLADTQVVSLEPLAALSNLETLNLHMDRNLGLQGRKGLDALRQLKNLTQLSIDVAEPLGDQLKDLRLLKSLVIYGPVKDVCSLKELTQLTALTLLSSGVQDISCLKNLKELVDITLQGNPIKSIAELAPLPNLMNLSIQNTLIEDLSALTGNPNMYIVEAEGTPLRWCSPKTAPEIQRGVSCFYPDGKEKPWWRRLWRWS